MSKQKFTAAYVRFLPLHTQSADRPGFFVFEEVLKMSSQSQLHAAVRQDRKSNAAKKKKKKEKLKAFQ